MSVQEILTGAKFPEDTIEVCMRQDLDLRLREATNRLAKALAAKDDPGDTRLVGRPDSAEIPGLEAEIQQIEEEMASHTLTFHFRGVASAEYNMLQRTAGKPRKDNKPDQSVGYNIQAFFEKAIKRCVYKVEAPDGDEQAFVEEQWKILFESINDGQMDDLCRGVEIVNRKATRNPTKARTSDKVNDSEQKQQQPTDLESPTSDSPDGSQPEPQPS